MQRVLAKILLFFLIIVPIRAGAQDEVEPGLEVSILSPGSGQAVRGSFPIIVESRIQGFVSAELIFAYEEAHEETWFLIHQSDQPLSKTVKIEWDTTLLTDGTYRLRMIVVLNDGTQLTSLVNGVRVRNYTPVETDTPTPSLTPAPIATPLPTETPIPSATPVPPTPTPLPPNPLVFTYQDIGINLLRGAAGGIAFLVLMGLYLSARNLFRK
jgi:hypothetical protein